jgi:drug/metabolite transporter (DMT)-like permease
MRPIGWIGVFLIVAGAVVLAMRGFSYTKDRQEVNLGPVGFTAVQKGFVPPWVGAAALALGVVLVFASRKRKA